MRARIPGAALVAVLLLSAPALAQSAKPAPTSAPAVSPGTPPPQAVSSSTPVPSATPEIYTPIACTLLVKRANLDKKPISAHTVGALTEAALRAHDFDALFTASTRAQQAAKTSRDPLVSAAAATAVVAAAKSLHRAQADVRACFGLR